MFLTDQLASYGKALLTHFGHWIEKVSEKSGRTLRRWMPVERLRYAQVKKKRRRRKIVAVTTQVVFGTKEAVQTALTAVGHKINTAFIERLNRTLRAHVPGLGRREEGLAKTKEGLLCRLRLVMGYYNFCLPHLSLRKALSKPMPTKGNGSPKKWVSRTPATCLYPDRWRPILPTTSGRWVSSCSFEFHPGDRSRPRTREKCVTRGKTKGLACPRASARREMRLLCLSGAQSWVWDTVFLYWMPFGRSLG